MSQQQPGRWRGQCRPCCGVWDCLHRRGVLRACRLDPVELHHVCGPFSPQSWFFFLISNTFESVLELPSLQATRAGLGLCKGLLFRAPPRASPAPWLLSVKGLQGQREVGTVDSSLLSSAPEHPCPTPTSTGASVLSAPSAFLRGAAGTQPLLLCCHSGLPAD